MNQTNIIPYKNRTLDITKPVEIYRNLNNKEYMYSVRQSGLVIGHSNKILLKNCKFIVRENGRQKVLKTKRKNVHAFVRGFIAIKGTMGVDINNTWRGKNRLPAFIKYNPYKWNSFICDNLTNHYFPVQSALGVQFDNTGIYGAYLNVL